MCLCVWYYLCVHIYVICMLVYQTSGSFSMLSFSIYVQQQNVPVTLPDHHVSTTSAEYCLAFYVTIQLIERMCTCILQGLHSSPHSGARHGVALDIAVYMLLDTYSHAPVL